MDSGGEEQQVQVEDKLAASLAEAAMASELGSRAHRVTLAEVLKFCFPDDLQHPNSGARLFLLAEHGPLHREHSCGTCLCDKCRRRLVSVRKEDDFVRRVVNGKAHLEPQHVGEADEDGQVPNVRKLLCRKCRKHCRTMLHLKGGFRGENIVNTMEMQQMEEEIVRYDLLRAYDREASLSLQEQNEFLSGLTVEKRKPKYFSKKEIRAMLAPLERDERNTIDFYELAAVVNGVRAEHVSELGFMLPKKVRGSSKSRVVEESSALTRSLLNVGRFPDHQTFTVTARLLNRRSHKIVEFDKRNAAGTVQNVYLMRDVPSDAATRWDGNAANRATRKGSYVRRERVTHRDTDL